MPTGTGKTVVFAELVRRQQTNGGGRALIVAHRTELLEQARNKLRDVGVWAALEKAEHRSRTERVVVASVQTLKGKRLRRFRPDEFDTIIVDEAHHATAASYRGILEYFKTALVLGVTATPDRADGTALGEIFASVAYRYELRDAIRDQWLVPIVARRIFLEKVDLSAIKSRAGDLAQDELAEVMATDEAVVGVVVPLLEQAGDRRTIVFGVDVAHSTAIAHALCERRPGSARVAHGEMDAGTRAELLADFRAGRFQFLVNCALFTEGFDEPCVACVACARPTKSRALYCLSEDTEVLTPEGWCGVGDRFDSAYGLDVDTDEIRLGQVTGRVHRQMQQGEAWVRFAGQQLDFAVTDQHSMIWRERLGRARSPSPWKIGTALLMCQRPDAVEVPVSGWERYDVGCGATDDELRFLGIVMTDGTIGRNRQITISQSAASPMLWEIRRVLRAIGVKFTERKIDRRGSGNNFEPTAPTVLFTMSEGTPRGRDKHLVGWGALRVAPLVGKTWHSGFERLAGRELRCLLDGMHIGDGKKSRRKGWLIAIGLQRRELADRMQSLCVRRGLAANILPAGRCVYLSVHDTTARTVPITRSDRPCVAVERGDAAQRVWCVETEVGTLITRRNGRVVIVGNCQMAGRGTRLLGATWAESLLAGKRDMLLLDFAGNAGRHKLVGPLDALAAGDVDESVRREAERMLEDDVQDLDGLVDEAAAALERRREEIRRGAHAQYFARDVDPFFGDQLGEPYDGPWALELATLEERTELAELGLKKIPAGMTRGEARQILEADRKRRQLGLATYKQCALLSRFGFDVKAMTKGAASARIGALAAVDWDPARARPRLQQIAASEMLAKNTAEHRAINRGPS